jgi:hypothetical protein
VPKGRMDRNRAVRRRKSAIFRGGRAVRGMKVGWNHHG